jgi:hypothetical protein
MGLRAQLLEQFQMTDSRIDAISSDTFAMLRDLLAVLADPKRTHEKLAELEARIKDAKKAEQRTATIRERASIDTARETALLDERRGELAKKARELLSREAYVSEREKALERTKVTHHDGTTFGSLVREREVRDGRPNTG